MKKGSVTAALDKINGAAFANDLVNKVGGAEECRVVVSFLAMIGSKSGGIGATGSVQIYAVDARSFADGYFFVSFD